MIFKEFFNNQFKAYFSNNKYPFTIQTRTKNDKHHIFVVGKIGLKRIFKDHWVTKSFTCYFWYRFNV